MSNPVKDSYPNGECPDCGESIPDTVAAGDACKNCEHVFNTQSAPDITDEAYVETARRLFHNDGTLEIDEGAEVSRGDEPGAYVKAWVWVPNSEVKKED